MCFLLLAVASTFLKSEEPVKPKSPLALPRKQGVIILRNDLIGGQPIGPQDIEYRVLNSEAVPNDAVVGERDLLHGMIGLAAVRPLVRGAILRKSDVSGQATGSPLARLLNPGMRAVTVPIDRSQAIAAQIQREDRVDLLALANPTSDEVQSSELLFTGVRIIAIHGISAKAKPPAENTSSTGNAGTSSVEPKGSFLTVELPPALAQRLASAAATRSLAILVRRRSDNSQNAEAPGIYSIKATGAPIERAQSVKELEAAMPRGPAQFEAPEAGPLVIRGIE